MSTVEIPKAEWPQFFHTFNASHGGWRCTLEILGERLGAQLQSSGLPLGGIDADDAKHSRITLALGASPAAHLTHIIDAPERVWLMHDETTQDEVVEIETADLRTLLRLHHA